MRDRRHAIPTVATAALRCRLYVCSAGWGRLRMSDTRSTGVSWGPESIWADLCVTRGLLMMRTVGGHRSCIARAAFLDGSGERDERFQIHTYDARGGGGGGGRFSVTGKMSPCHLLRLGLSSLRPCAVGLPRICTRGETWTCMWKMEARKQREKKRKEKCLRLEVSAEARRRAARKEKGRGKGKQEEGRRGNRKKEEGRRYTHSQPPPGFSLCYAVRGGFDPEREVSRRRVLTVPTCFCCLCC